jgi:hypothetical protein
MTRLRDLDDAGREAVRRAQFEAEERAFREATPMQDAPQLRRRWAARDRVLRRRQTWQTIGVVLATVVLALLPTLIWINFPEAG